jgi:hypothetical protein
LLLFTQQRIFFCPDSDRDVAAADISAPTEVEVFATFESMGLKEDLLRGVYSYGKKASLEAILFLIDNK